MSGSCAWLRKLPEFQSMVESMNWEGLHKYLLQKLGTEKHYLYESEFNIYDILTEHFDLRNKFWVPFEIVSDDAGWLFILELAQRGMMEYQNEWLQADSFWMLP